MPIIAPTTPPVVPPAPNRGTDANEAFRTKVDNLLSALAGIVSWMATSVAAVFNNTGLTAADAAATAADRVQTGLDRDAAALSASSAANAPGTMLTSTQPVEIGTGLKTFPSQPGKSLAKGVPMEAVSRGNVQMRMVAFVDSYDAVTGALVLDVQSIRGSGTFSDWNIFTVSSPLFLEGYGMPQATLSTAGPHLLPVGAYFNIDLTGANVQVQCPPNPAQGAQATVAVGDRGPGRYLDIDPNGQRFRKGTAGEHMQVRTANVEITMIFEGGVWCVYPRAKG